MSLPLDSSLKLIQRQTEEENAQALADRLGFSYENLDNYPFNLAALSLLSLESIEQEGFAVFLHTADKIRVATIHPEDSSVLEKIQALGQKLSATVELTVVSPSSLRYLRQAYAQLLTEQQEDQQEAQRAASMAEQKDYFKNIKTLDDLQKEIEKANTTEVLDVILAAAFNQEASDVHLEPGEDTLIVRFRIDGVLQKVLELSMAQHHQQLVSRIKLLASMHLDNQNTAQDGRFSLSEKGINADLRVSIIPTGYGEGIVMRILRQDMKALTLNQLGFSAHNQELIAKAVRKPYGLILVTGPTGSGKSTTLYALLQELNTPERKIITLEDPIEYRVAGVQQSQVNPEKDFDFAEGLKGALRQDPDVVMVGEIRDTETATIALNASLTGHLVLSTLHTNNAVTAAARLLEMGIEPYLLSGSIQVIIAQRLVRKVAAGSTPEVPLFHGRLVIAEVLTPNQEFEQAVLAHKDQVSLQEIAVRGGMVPMQADGLEKVRAGLTVESEISRVTEV